MRSSIKTLTVAALTAGALVAAPAAFAEPTTTNDVVQTVGGGALSASVAGGALTEIKTAHIAKASETAFTLTADDLTGTADGWNVTQQITELAYSGDNGGDPIAAGNFSVTPGTVTANDPAVLDGVTASSGVVSLDEARTVLTAAAGSGVGNYTQAIAATLTVPADSRAGTYTGTLTTTISVPVVTAP